MRGRCYVVLQVFIVLLGLGAVVCCVLCCIWRHWLEALVAGVLASLCIHVCILQAGRAQLEKDMLQAALRREETARMEAKIRGLELEEEEEGAAGHLERPPAKNGPPVPSAVSPTDRHNPFDEEVVADQHNAVGKVSAEDLDKAKLNALAMEYLRCSMALQDYRKRYGPLESKDSDCSAKRQSATYRRRTVEELFTMDPASDVNVQKIGNQAAVGGAGIGDLKNMAEDISGAGISLAPTPNLALPTAMQRSTFQAEGGCLGAAGGRDKTGTDDNGAGVTQLLPDSPRGGPPSRPVQVRRRQPGQSRQGPPTVSLAGQSRHAPPSVSLAARDHSRYTDSCAGPGLV